MEPAQTWISEPDRLLHIFLSSLVFFVFIIVVTRISGKRTTGNMNNFDWIITVGIGSLMASGILLRNVSMLDAMVAVASLAGLQWVTTWSVMHSSRVARLVKPLPRVLMKNGAVQREDMRRERIAHEELEAALRSAGLERSGTAAWVVIESNGQLSVIPKRSAGRDEKDLLADVVGAEKAP